MWRWRVQATSIVTSDTGSGSSACIALVRSITTTRGSFRSFQSSMPYPVSIAYTLAAPRRRRQSTNPPTFEPRSAQGRPVTSRAKAFSAWSSFCPARETNGMAE